jgi:sodium transport system permease protein
LYHAAPGSAFSALGALSIALASVGTLLVVSVTVAMLGVDMTIAVAVGQLALLVVPVIAMRVGKRTAHALGISRPRLRFVAAAVLVGCSAWYLNMHLVDMLPFQPRDARFLVQLVDGPSLVVVVLAIAIAPALCEEIVFRGVLLRGLASQLHAWVAVLGSAMVFSIYHLNPIQMAPTLMLGLVFGLIAHRAGSAIPTMAAHALNNGIAILVARGELPGLANAQETGFIDRHPALAVAGAATLTASGIALALLGRPTSASAHP